MLKPSSQMVFDAIKSGMNDRQTIIAQTDLAAITVDKAVRELKSRQLILVDRGAYHAI